MKKFIACMLLIIIIASATFLGYRTAWFKDWTWFKTETSQSEDNFSNSLSSSGGISLSENKTSSSSFISSSNTSSLTSSSSIIEPFMISVNTDCQYDYINGYYPLSVNKETTFSLNTLNVDGDSLETDYNISINAYGSLYVGTSYATEFGTSELQDVYLINLNLLVSDFFEYVNFVDGVLTIKPKHNFITFYSSLITGTDDYGINYSFFTNRVVLPLDFVNGTCNEPSACYINGELDSNYEVYNKYNFENISKCYFTIDIVDTISNLTKTIKFNIKM